MIDFLFSIPGIVWLIILTVVGITIWCGFDIYNYFR